MDSENKKISVKNVSCIVLCAALGFIAVTISSKNSFLYSFNDSSDIQTFVTTARCMLRGDVLYRDVFDVKGPLLYFFYMLGLLMDGNTFHGIFLLESLLFMTFSVLSFYLTDLYFENNVLKIVVSGATSFVSTTSVAFFGGGQCEELLLPVLALVVYLVLKYFRRIYPAPIPWRYTVLIGVCAAVTVWVKYTLAGIFGGLVLYVIWLQISQRRWKELWRYVGGFLIGFMLGSVPVIIYLAKYHAWDAMLEVYFYDLMFSYKTPEDTPTHFLTNDFYLHYIGASAPAAFAFVYPMLDGGRHLKKQERHIIPLMVFFMAVGLSFGRRWVYTTECMQVFVPLGTVGLLYTVLDCRERLGELMRKLSSFVDKLMAEDVLKNQYLAALLTGALLLMNTDIFVIPVVVVLTGLLAARVIQKNLTPCLQKRSKLFLVKYVFFIVIYYVYNIKMSTSLAQILNDTDNALAIRYFLRVTILLVALSDFSLFADEIQAYLRSKTEQWKKEYDASGKKINILIGVMALGMYCFYCFSLSKSSYDIGSVLEDKPQAKLVSYIQNSGVEDPIVIYYKDIDFGYYWLSGAYPHTRFSCDFNMNLPELTNLYEEYVDGRRADFIITSIADDNFSIPGYTKVFSGQSVYVEETYTMQFVLWQRD